MPKASGREAITALRVAFESEPQLVVRVSVGGFESSGSTEVATSFRELFGFQREFAGESVGFSGERSRKVRVSQELPEPREEIVPLTLSGCVADRFPARVN
jgi:hypothetical protein